MSGQRAVDTRRHIGMVFQKPNPFPAMTIADNVLSGLKFSRVSPASRADLVEEMLTKAGLWNEVKDRLGELGGALSGGQQQRLCIARALAVRPRVLLMDEPCSALDPTSTLRIERTIKDIADEVTVVIVTHNMQQAQRVSDYCAFFLAEENRPGRVVESGTTEMMFTEPDRPKDRRLCQWTDSADRAGRRPRVRSVVSGVAPCDRFCWRPSPSGGRRSLWRCCRRVPARRCSRPVRVSPAWPSSSGWAQASTLYGLNINWQVTSSVIGLNNFAQNQVDFAASDIPYSSGQATSQPLRALPVHARRGRRSGLHVQPDRQRRPADHQPDLNASVADQIFLGEIIYWDDSAIKAINQHLAPDLPAHQDRPRLPIGRIRRELPPLRLHAPPGPSQLQRRPERLPVARSPVNPTPRGRPRPASVNVGSPPFSTTYPGWAQNNLVGPERLGQRRQLRLGPVQRGAITYVETAYAKEHAFPVASVAQRQRQRPSSPPRSTWPPPWRRPSSTPT